MPPRNAPPSLSPETLDTLMAMNTRPGLEVEEQVEARKLLHSMAGPNAEVLSKYCTRLAAALRENQSLKEKVELIEQGPRLHGIVVGLEAEHVHVHIGGTQRILPRPVGLALEIGQIAVTDAEAKCILGAGTHLNGGQAFAFCERLGSGHALVRSVREGVEETGRQLALVSSDIDLEDLSPGDHVLAWTLDSGNLVLVTRRLDPIRPAIDEPVSFRAPARSEIVGLDEILAELDLLFLSGDSPAFQKFFDRASAGLRGFLLHGPTGVGKSKVAEYFSGRVVEAGGRALFRTASHYLNKWVGEGAATMRADFAELDEHHERTGKPSLLVIDEIEAIAVDRSHGASLNAGHLDVIDTLLALLTRTNTRVIGISNLADRVIDTAITRDGRLRIVPFPATLPAEAAAELIGGLLTDLPLEEDEEDDDSAEAVGQALADFVYSPTGPVAELFTVQLADGSVVGFGAPDLVTGAVVADGIIRPTLAQLAQRDLGAGRAEPAPIRLDDLRAAAVSYFFRRAETVSRDNVRRLLPDRLPEDQQVTRVERKPIPSEWKPPPSGPRHNERRAAA